MSSDSLASRFFLSSSSLAARSAAFLAFSASFARFLSSDLDGPAGAGAPSWAGASAEDWRGATSGFAALTGAFSADMLVGREE